VLAKVREYFHYGVQVVWVIAPEERQVYVYDAPTHVRILTGQEELNGGEVVPGFHLPLVHLFQHAAAPTVAPAS
jgi:Uma2 family endonuclease